jgi:hypothetical protein
MSGIGKFGFGGAESYAKLSKMLINQKQALSDVTAITPVWKDPDLITTIKAMVPFVNELKRVSVPESTYRWEKQSADNFAKFTTEATAASAFAAQKGTYGESTVVTKLLTYVMNVGILGQKATANYLDLMRNEQAIAMTAVDKAIERCVIQGDYTGGASDGGPTDSNAFHGIGKLVTTNVYNPTTAEALSLETLDLYIDKLVDYGVREQDLIIVTDSYTKTKLAQLFYNTYNIPMGMTNINAGFKVESYRNAPVFASSYVASKVSGSREMYIIDKNSTVLAEFYKTSQLDLGRTTLSDDSIMFWMGALAVKDEPANAIIKKIV